MHEKRGHAGAESGGNGPILLLGRQRPSVYSVFHSKECRRKAEEAVVCVLFAYPQHPYTIGLLSAIPWPFEGAESRERLKEIPGRVPSVSELIQACAFAERCPRADELTRSQIPELREVRPEHFVACFHPGENGAA